MDIPGTIQIRGDEIAMNRTHPKHIATQSEMVRETGIGEFEGMMLRALNGANDLELEAARLGEQMVVNPDSVDPHDVTIAMAQANLAVSLTKAVVDGALDAYNNIINMR